jgi:hypothetical protein
MNIPVHELHEGKVCSLEGIFQGIIPARGACHVAFSSGCPLLCCHQTTGNTTGDLGCKSRVLLCLVVYANLGSSSMSFLMGCLQYGHHLCAPSLFCKHSLQNECPHSSIRGCRELVLKTDAQMPHSNAMFIEGQMQRALHGAHFAGNAAESGPLLTLRAGTVCRPARSCACGRYSCLCVNPLASCRKLAACESGQMCRSLSNQERTL